MKKNNLRLDDIADVKTSLTDAKEIRKLSTTINIDAHDNDPTKLLSKKDEKNLIFQSLELNEDPSVWEDFVLGIVFPLTTFVRSHEFRSIRYPFLRLDEGGIFSPYDTGPMATCLINLREPGSTKTRESKKTAVGGWRHRDFFRCFHSILAFKVAREMNEMVKSEIFEYFLLQNKEYYAAKNLTDTSKPPFYDIFVSRWKNYEYSGQNDKGANPMQRHFSNKLKQFNIKRYKCAVFRADGMIRSMNLGAPKHNITMMSGHVSNKDQADKAYFTPVNHTVCLTSSGFSYHPKEEYFIPRSCAAYKIIQDSKCKTGIDFYDKWTASLFTMLAGRKEIFSCCPSGQKVYSGESAYHFVHKLIPYFGKVMIEDGIMWCTEFPDHHFSKFMLSRLEGYAEFVCVAYNEMERLQKEYDQSEYSHTKIFETHFQRVLFLSINYRQHYSMPPKVL